MVAIKDFGMPKCCMNCEMFDGEYGNCDIMGDTQDFEYQWNENRPFDCPLVEAIPKDQYEARLKADMVAMLEEIDGDIERLQLMCDKDDLNNMYQYTAFGMTRDKIIEKINSLKGDQEGKNE
jgi:hypothetical protein